VDETAGGPDDNDGAAVERGELARLRAEQLQERGRELTAGEPATARTAREAQDRAELALGRAKTAHHAAAGRHLDAGRAHRKAAAAHEQAALRAPENAADAHQSAAERHRDEADRHDAAAIEQFAAEDADRQRMR
jgi:hypothetical protein